MEIYPTHTCFDDVLDFIVELIKLKKPFEDIFVVHGICVADSCGEYSHAWCEYIPNDNENVHVLWWGILDGKKKMFAYHAMNTMKNLKLKSGYAIPHEKPFN